MEFSRVLFRSPPGLFFFFSSRRRHTSFSRDWSSDVCSPDLLPGGVHRLGGGARGRSRPPRRARAAAFAECADPSRSEERRVGKEGRDRRAQEARQKMRKAPTRLEQKCLDEATAINVSKQRRH